MELTLENLGLTKKELQNRVIERVCETLMTTVFPDDEGGGTVGSSKFVRKLEAAAQKRIDAAVTKLAETHIAPQVTKSVETMELEETDRWGHKVGKPVGFITYVVQRFESYMMERVDTEGRSS